MKIPKKLRNKNAWLSTLSLIFFVLRTYFKIEIPQQETLLNLILLCGSAWGIWMVNPNVKE